MSPEIRNRILAAAARVYAQYGFRGATTRLIATEAGVNEVTLFRTFGSKADLLEAMLQSQVSGDSAPLPPTVVDDPQAELTVWCGRMIEFIRGHAHLIRKTMGEAEERPDAACAACQGPNQAGDALVLYVERLREAGLADDEVDSVAAVSMFMSAMFGDALYRDIDVKGFPQPAEEAPAKYVKVFLRAVGYRSAQLPVRSRQLRVAGSRRRSR